MANTIDRRIVEMSFDNSKFNSNAEASIGVLDKLKKALKLDGSQDAFNNLESSSKKVNLSSLISAVENVSSRFTNLGIIGVTALQRITNSAITAGKDLVNSLTLEPVMSGYNEYELKLNSIQTILANTQKEGATLDDVNRILNDLNEYADKTIYNFAQMTRNIGTFTAAGVELQTSANAIKGIANLAALSGSNATQASTAMYQLSQAIAAGRVSLQDWNSVVNAGMGGQIFQDALRDTAEAMGIVVDRTESFRESISATGGATSWLTSDVLVSTLELFTGDLTEAELAAKGFNNEQIAYYLRLGKTAVDSATKVRTLSQLFDTLKESVTSGWATTWEIIFGNFEEATELFTHINDVVSGFFNTMSDARNTMLLTWKDLGGREKLIDNLSMAFRALQRIVEPVIKAFQEIFPPTTAQQLIAFIGNIRGLAQTFMLSRREMTKLQNAFEGLFSILDIIGTTVIDVISVGFEALGLVFDTVGGSVLDIASNTGTAIKSFRDWYKEVRPVKAALETVLTVIRAVVNGIKQFVSAVSEIPQVAYVISAVSKAFTSVQTAASQAWEYITQFVRSALSLDNLTFENIRVLFADLLKKLSTIKLDFGDLNKLFEKLKEIGKNALEELGKGFEKVKEVVDDVVGYIKTAFDNVDLGHALTLALAGTVIASLLSLKRLTDAISSPLEAFTGIFKSVSTVLNNFAKKFKPNAFTEAANAIQKIAISVGILAVSLALLSKMDQGKLREAAVTLGVLTGALIVLNGVMGLISRLGKGSGDVKGVSVNMLSAAASILILVQALKQIQGMDQNGILKSLGILAALMVGLSGMTIAISKFAPKLSSSSFMMISASASLLIMVQSLKQLQGLNLEGVQDSLKVMAICMGLLAVVSIAAGKVKAGTALGMIGIAASLAIIVEVLKQVMALDLSGAESNLESLQTVLGMFVALVAAAGLGSKKSLGTGVGVLAMSASILVIIEAIRQISKLGATEVSRAMKVIVQIEILFAAITALSHFAGGNAAKAGVGILAMSAAMVVLSGAMAIMATIDPAGLQRALKAVTVLGVMMAMILVATAVAKDATKQLIVTTACVTVLAAVTAALSLIEPSKLQNGLTAVTLLGTVLSGMLIATRFAGPVNANLILATLAVGALGLVIAGLAQLPVGTVLPIAEGLSVLMLAVAAALRITNGIPFVAAVKATGGIMVAIAGISAVIAAIVTIAGLIAKIPNIDIFLGGAQSVLSKIGIAFGSFIGGIGSGIAAGAASAMPLVGNSLSQFMTNLGPFIEGLEKIKPEMATAAKTLADALLTLTAGNLLSTITGFFGGETSLSGFAETLGELGSGFETFYDNVKDIDPSIVESSAAAAQALAELEDALPNQGGILAEWIGDNTLSQFAEALPSLGEALSSYCTSISEGGFNADTVTDSANAAMALAELANNLPNSGGALGWWVGENDLGDFATQLPVLGVALSSYCVALSAGGAFDATVVTDSANAAMAIANLANNLPNSGGALEWWVGGNDLDAFAQQLPILGIALASYCRIISYGGFNATAVEKSATAAMVLADLADAIPETGGIISIFTGDNKLDQFGDNLVSFGESLTSYSSSVASLNHTAVENSVTSAQLLVDLANTLTDTKWGEETLSSFGYKLIDLGLGLATYYGYISSIDTETMQNMTDQLTQLRDLGASFADVDMSGLTTLTETLFTVATQAITTFTTELQNGAEQAKTAVINLMTATKTAFLNNAVQFTNTGSTLINKFITGINNRQGAVKSAGTSIRNALVNGLKTNNAEYNTLGTTYGNNFATGVRSKEQAARDSGSALSNAAASEIEKVVSRFEEAGRNAGDGFANALSEKASKAVEAARKMAEEAANAINSSLDINSPSRVTGLSGEYFVLGFANEIQRLSYLASESAADMGEKSVSAFQRSVESAGEAARSIVDLYPTITPVLDLSQIQNGSRSLNSIFANRSIALAETSTRQVSAIARRASTPSVSTETAAVAAQAPSINFTQNNYSPKALSNIEIYRQTRNLVSQAKVRVGK